MLAYVLYGAMFAALVVIGTVAWKIVVKKFSAYEKRLEKKEQSLEEQAAVLTALKSVMRETMKNLTSTCLNKGYTEQNEREYFYSLYALYKKLPDANGENDDEKRIFDAIPPMQVLRDTNPSKLRTSMIRQGAWINDSAIAAYEKAQGITSPEVSDLIGRIAIEKMKEGHTSEQVIDALYNTAK